MIGRCGRTSASSVVLTAGGNSGVTHAKRWSGRGPAPSWPQTGLAACSRPTPEHGPVTWGGGGGGVGGGGGGWGGVCGGGGATLLLLHGHLKATSTAISNCDKESGGKYTISYSDSCRRPRTARQQLVAGWRNTEASIEIRGLSPPPPEFKWESEFDDGGLDRGRGPARTRPRQCGHASDPPMTPRHWKGQARSGTQQQQYPAAVVPVLTWYRSRRIHLDEMIADADSSAKGGQVRNTRDTGRASTRASTVC